MKINVQKIKNKIGTSQPFHFVTTADKLCLNDERLWIDGDISVNGEAVNTGRGFKIIGLITAMAKCECDRCLKEFEQAVEIAFSELFRDNADEKEADISGYEGDLIDLTEVIHENIIMAKPLKTLCSEGCRGLCPKCGANLNITQCACEHDLIDPRLAALKKIFEKQP